MAASVAHRRRHRPAYTPMFDYLDHVGARGARPRHGRCLSRPVPDGYRDEPRRTDPVQCSGASAEALARRRAHAAAPGRVHDVADAGNGVKQGRGSVVGLLEGREGARSIRRNHGVGL
jgi:hypothetical protein